MSGTQTGNLGDDPSDDSVADQIILFVDGEEIVIDRAKVEKLADRIASGPDGSDGLFTFMAGLPGAELTEEQELGPVGPAPRENEV